MDTFLGMLEAAFPPAVTPSLQAVENEEEFCFYVEVSDDTIEKMTADAASQTYFEQYELPVWAADLKSVEGRIRARKCVPDNALPTFVLTMKGRSATLDNGATTRPEAMDLPLDADQFQVFCKLAASFTKKRRLKVPVAGTPTDAPLFWEIDVYLRADGTTSKWVKVDLEHSPSLPPFPYQGTARIAATEDGVSVVSPDKVSQIYMDEYNQYNPNVWARPEQ